MLRHEQWDELRFVYKLEGGERKNGIMWNILVCSGFCYIHCVQDRSIAVWDMQSPTEINLRRVLVGHRAAVNVVDFDEKYIVSASGDRTIKVSCSCQSCSIIWRCVFTTQCAACKSLVMLLKAAFLGLLFVKKKNVAWRHTVSSWPFAGWKGNISVSLTVWQF